MGYRSDFKLTTTNDGYDKLNEIMKKYCNKEMLEMDCFNVKYQQASNLTYSTYKISGDYLKMYSSYPEIQALEEFMDYCDENKILYSYARIGEEKEDNEERGVWPDKDYDIIRVDICRYINEY